MKIFLRILNFKIEVLSFINLVFKGEQILIIYICKLHSHPKFYLSRKVKIKLREFESEYKIIIRICNIQFDTLINHLHDNK